MKESTFFTLILSLLLYSCSAVLNSYKSEIDGVYIPKNLEEAVEEVDEFYTDSIKREIIKLSEDEFGGRYHMGLGLWMRNNWNLWNSSRLRRYFKRRGIRHPDDMSGIVLTSFFRKLNGEEILLDVQIENYKSYWKENLEINKLVKLPKKSKHPSKNLIFDYKIWYTSSGTKSLIHIQTNSKNDSLYIYDHIFGWERIHIETEKKLRDRSKFKTDSLMNLIHNNDSFP